MWVRRRIAALALFGVQLLQGVLPAAGAACEPPANAVPAGATLTAATAAHHHHSALAEPAAERFSGTSDAVPAPHNNAPAACPMAMTCTVVGVMSSAVAVSTVDIDIDEHRPLHVADWPVSLDIAPETPPPRA